MELGLRLGDAPPFGFPQKPPDPNVSHRGLDFCLGFSSISSLDQDEQIHNQKRRELPRNDVVGRFFDPPPSPSPPVLQLDLLPRTPVAASRRSSENTDLSEGAAAAVFTDVITAAPPSATAAEGGGGCESPRNPLLCSSLEFEFRKYGRGAAAGGGGLFEMEEGNYSERACSRGSDEEDQNLGSKKKLRLSREQSAFLEESFKEHHTLYPKQKLELARRLNLRPRQVEVWFQNRRARTKLKQTEVDCEYLKKCCETLTQENRKLQKELQDLRALKTTDSLFMHSPATTLTMCASCERAAACGGGKEQANSKASGFSFTRTGSFPFSRTDPSRENY